MWRTRNILVMMLLLALAGVATATPASADGSGARTPAAPEFGFDVSAQRAGTTQPSAEECAAVDAYHKEGQRRNAALQVALNEAGVGVGFTDPAAVDLEPAIARQLAAIATDAIQAQRTAAVPPVLQGAHDSYVAFLARTADGFNGYADTVEAGVDPDEALAALANDPETLRLANEFGERLLPPSNACNPAPDAATARTIAGLTEAAAQAQAAAHAPAVARTANDALLTFLKALAAGASAYADAVAAGAGPEETADPLTPAERPALAADEQLRGLLERCGLSIGVDEPGDGVPPLSNGQCRQAFDWYQVSTQRFAELNAALRAILLNLGKVGIALPGNLGSVDLTDRRSSTA